MADLSILIPAKSEKYLNKTIEDIFKHAKANTEVLVGLDGREHFEPFELQELSEKYNVRVFMTQRGETLGQRALTNVLARQSNAKYLMKIDAHCSFSSDFDVELMKEMDDKTIMAPYMVRLDAENWTPIPKPVTSMYHFDPDLVMQYGVNNDDTISETMCLQGSAWMITRENYWKWNICDETLGSWGGQAAELGIKAYLNGGVCKTNKNCFYAHLFREKEEDFPYQRDKAHIRATLDELRKRFKNKNIAGLIEKFKYPCGWTKELVAQLPEV